MTTSTSQIFALIGMLLIIGLSVYAIILWRQVFINNKKIQQLQQQQKQQLLEAINIIARTMVEQDLNSTEGCIRLRVLLEKLDPELLESDEYKVIDDMYQRSKEFATHKARRSLPITERLIQDQQREAMEEELKQEIKNAAQALGNLSAAYKLKQTSGQQK